MRVEKKLKWRLSKRKFKICLGNTLEAWKFIQWVYKGLKLEQKPVWESLLWFGKLWCCDLDMEQREAKGDGGADEGPLCLPCGFWHHLYLSPAISHYRAPGAPSLLEICVLISMGSGKAACVFLLPCCPLGSPSLPINLVLYTY